MATFGQGARVAKGAHDLFKLLEGAALRHEGCVEGPARGALVTSGSHGVYDGACDGAKEGGGVGGHGRESFAVVDGVASNALSNTEAKQKINNNRELFQSLWMVLMSCHGQRQHPADTLAAVRC